MSQTCPKPPPGWLCTRTFAHEGPCAAIRNDEVIDKEDDDYRQSDIVDEWAIGEPDQSGYTRYRVVHAFRYGYYHSYHVERLFSDFMDEPSWQFPHSTERALEAVVSRIAELKKEKV